MKYLQLTFGLIVLLSSSAFSQNINVSNYIFHDMEPYIAVNPTNENNVIGAWMRVTGFSQVTIAVSRSADGGATWSTPVLMPHLVSTYTHADVSISFNASGKAFMAFIDYATTLDSGNVMICNSVDNGATWSTPTIAINGMEHSTRPIDRPWLTIDNSSSMYNGRLYLTAKNPEGFSPNHVWFKYSTDDGATWSSLKQIDSIPAGSVMSMGNIAIGANGSVNIAYLSYDISSSLFLRALMVKSSNGGSSFNAATVIGNYTGANTINDTLQFSSTLSANPTNANNLIFTYTDGLTGDADIVRKYSNDGGNTWSLAQTINDDGLSNGIEQDMSWAGFSPNGTYAVVWRDRRNSGTSVVSPFEIFTAVSLDGGTSFKPNVNLSSAISPDIPIQKGNDFIGICLSNTYLHANWSDNRTGNNEIFTQGELIGNLTTISNENSITFGATVFPNPVNHSLTVHLTKPAEKVHFWIYTPEGKLVHSGRFTNQSDYIINCKNLEQGSYIIKISDGKSTLEHTFIKN